jgi:hypothetical protein
MRWRSKPVTTASCGCVPGEMFMPRFVPHLFLSFWAGLLFASGAVGEGAAAPQPFNVPAGKAERTLRIFAGQSQQSAVFSTDMVQGVTTHAVKGDYTAAEALELMLAGTRLVPATDGGSGALVIRSRTKQADRIVELPPYIVETLSLDHQLPWTYASIPGVEVISRCSDTTTALLLAHHFRLHEMLDAFLPREFQVRLDAATTYVLYNSASQPGIPRELVEELKKREPDSTRWNVQGLSNYRFQDPDAVAMFFVIEEPTFRQGRLSLTPDYVRYVLENRTPSLPRWFVEGMLLLYDRSVLETTPDPSAINSVSNARLPEGMVVVRPLIWLSDAATGEIRKNPRKAVELPALATLFSPPWLSPTDEAATRLWQAQAALFIRWALDDGSSHARRAALHEFVRRAGTQPVTEEMFRACFGLGFSEMDEQLRLYLPHAIRSTLYLRPEKTSEPPVPKLRDATDSEVSRIKGGLDRMEIAYVQAVYPHFTSRYVAQARRTLRKSYDKGDRDPRLLAELGLCECDAGDDVAARPFLETAVLARVVRPRVYYELARIDYQATLRQAPDGRLTVGEAAEVLQPLAIALKQAPPLARTYDLIAEVWLRTDGRLSPAQLAILDEGMQLFPWRPRLVYSAALLNSLHGNIPKAQTLVEAGLALVVDPADRGRFLQLRAALDPAAGGPGPAAVHHPAQ